MAEGGYTLWVPDRNRVPFIRRAKSDQDKFILRVCEPATFLSRDLCRVCMHHEGA